ncbi:hypothetical protein SmJEL517_g04557 [Synchytrium microbalum]|uniref:Yos1-like protein n=1 Tax=Synchytrium microbalum TaxID=1806994 RepID=A0A507C2W8_9FUNG|nr:uncharacterized protein SmJEL517_g04557 [Synchytrium microbalum]TPX32296.1 hypothetical protein SmJEL517_g04557 [Synchytrium microbalum]
MAILSFGFGLGTIFYVSVLLVNAIAILHEDRFLARIGFTSSAVHSNAGFGDQQQPSVKARLIIMMSAIRTLLRIPLVAVNIFIIIWELLLG